MTPNEALAAMLRPAGGGLYVVSTGRAQQLAVQQQLYGVADEAAIQAAFLASLDRIASAKAIILGVPSDTGAGFRRGANLAGEEIRGLGRQGAFHGEIASFIVLICSERSAPCSRNRPRIPNLCCLFEFFQFLHERRTGLFAAAAAYSPRIPGRAQ